jgi:hypothetical protein
MEQLQDLNLTCRDCDRVFIYSKKEQDFFARHGWDAPIRCPACRTQKAMRTRDAHPAKDYR